MPANCSNISACVDIYLSAPVWEVSQWNMTPVMQPIFFLNTTLNNAKINSYSISWKPINQASALTWLFMHSTVALYLLSHFLLSLPLSLSTWHKFDMNLVVNLAVSMTTDTTDFCAWNHIRFFFRNIFGNPLAKTSNVHLWALWILQLPVYTYLNNVLYFPVKGVNFSGGPYCFYILMVC